MVGFISFTTKKKDKSDIWMISSFTKFMKLKESIISIDECLHDAGKECEEKGYEHATNQVSKDTGLSTIEALLSQVIKILLTRLKGQIEGLKIQIEKLKTEIQSTENQRDSQAYNEDLGHYTQNLSGLNLFWGILYFIAAISLILADLPLTLKIGKEVFKLSLPDNFGMIEDFTIILYSIGLLFSTLFFKYYYEIYINRSSKDHIKNLTNTIQTINLSYSDKVKFYTVRVLKFIFNTTILAACLFNLFTLGEVRYEHSTKDSDDSPQTETTQGNEGNSETNYNEEETPSEENKDKESSDERGSDKIALILSSVLFPFLGGIFFVISNTKLKYVLHERKYKLKIEKARKKEAQLSFLKAQYEELVNWINEKEKGATFQEESKTYLSSCYISGYEKGVAQSTQVTTSNLDLLKKHRKTNLIKNIAKTN